MAARRILQLGDPLLRKASAAVANAAEAASTWHDMRDTLHEFQRTHGFGRGISAVQIGVAERIVYLEFEGISYCLINPEWEYLSAEKFRLWDDCFSFPELLVWVERSEIVRLRYQNELDAPKSLEAAGALAELIQHEMDHLDGVLAIDRALPGNSLCTREEWRRQYGPRPGTIVNLPHVQELPDRGT
jgi:peptide deformylase